jgi:hypothetical protein
VLQGTFDTLSFPEVLRLLAASRKEGALRIDAGVAATLWFGDGRVGAAEGGDLVEPTADRGELFARLVDIGFAVVRSAGGTFRFAADETAPWAAGETIGVEDVLTEIDGLLAQWREIESVVPSLECRPVLSDELEAETLEVDRELWRLLVRIDGRRTVRDLAHRTGRSVLDLCHALIDLARAGAVGFAPEVEAAPKPSARGVGVELEEPYGPGVETPHPGPKARSGNGHAPRERGELLRVFSALQD